MKHQSAQKLLPFLLTVVLSAALVWYYDTYVDWRPNLYPIAYAASTLGVAALTLFTLWTRGERKALALVWKTALSVAVFAGVILFGVSFAINIVIGDGKLPRVAVLAALPLAAAQALVLLLLCLRGAGLSKAKAWAAVPVFTLAAGGILCGSAAIIKYTAIPPRQPQFTAPNLLEGAGAENLRFSQKFEPDGSYIDFELPQAVTFNTAMLEEQGDNVQYFRLQAWVDGDWQTVYRSEKIGLLRLCSFDAVTTGKVRLRVDKFRGDASDGSGFLNRITHGQMGRFRLLRRAVVVKSMKLYNEPKRDAGNFRTVAYQIFADYSEMPTEVLAKGDAYVKDYVRFYDVYNTIIIIGAVGWDQDGNLTLHGKEEGEEDFARQLAALREMIARRSNPEHEVKLLICALAQGNANEIMRPHADRVAEQIIGLAAKYGFDGVDIDWENPDNPNDWRIYDDLVARVDDGIKADNPDAILSAALAAATLKMSTETLNRFDQIQYMAYDDGDRDGIHSTLQKAVADLPLFLKKGADLSKINIGIGAYARPLNGVGILPEWRLQPNANYWDSLYRNIDGGGAVFDGAYCSPAAACDKTAYALLSGAGGVMLWHLGGDRSADDPVSVTGGIEDALRRYAAGW